MRGDDNFIKERAISLKYVFKGMWLLVSREHAAMAQVSIFALFIVLGIVFGISTVEWVTQTICCGMILTAEALNTAVEKICDYIQPAYDKRIGFIKDVSAGAVGFAACTGVIVVIVIYYKYFAQLFI